MSPVDLTAEVKSQYEDFPYPARDPEQEKRWLISTTLDPLAKINHYCYGGRGRIDGEFRSLVAGGGTGDSAIYLAEQLRERGARVPYLDSSRASAEIARRRAAVRGLDNIDWVQASLLDLPDLDLGEFDYINCSGVLHHLEDPAAGLAALLSALKEDGSLGIMVYGRYGREGIYQIQEIMSRIGGEQGDYSGRLRLAKSLLARLPESNWFARSRHLFSDMDSDDCIVDAFLHARDRAYTVPELHAWLGEAGLHLTAFASRQANYRPETFIDDPELLRAIKALPAVEQQAIAELIDCSQTKHTFYASRSADRVADPLDLENVPVLHNCEDGYRNFYAQARQVRPGDSMSFSNPQCGSVSLRLGSHARYLFKYIDGYSSLARIFEKTRRDRDLRKNPPTTERLLAEFNGIYQPLNSLDLMLLRHESVGSFVEPLDLQRRVARMHVLA